MSGIRRTRMHRSVALCIMDFEGGHGETPFVRPVPLVFLPLSSLRTFSDIPMKIPFLGAFGSMTLLASAVVLAAENITVNTPNGDPFLIVKVFDVGETSSDWDGDRFTAERELTDREVGLIASGLGYWGAVFQDALKNTAPAVVEFVPYSNHSGNAAAFSLLAGTDGNTWLSAALLRNEFSYSENGGSAVILLELPLSPEIDWYAGTLHTLAQNGNEPHLASFLIHELTHALGVMALLSPEETISDEGIEYGSLFIPFLDTRFNEAPSVWIDGLRDVDGDRARPGMIISWKDTGSRDEFNMPIVSEGAEGANGVYFTGEHVSEVIQDAEIAYPNNGSDYRVNGIPVVGWEMMPNNDEWILYPELSHLELQNSLLSHQNWRNWTVPMEAELAVMQDLGFAIDRRDWFGYSIYQSGESEENRRVFVNANPYYDRNDAGDGWRVGVPNDNAWGIGLHVYGSYNDVTQAADLLTTGAYGTGIRLEGTGNVLRIASDTVVAADGEEGCGILVSYGKDHRIEHRGTVTALGAKGVAARFDFGSNILGDGIEKRGSYISVLDPDYSYGTPEERLEQSGLDGALVKNFDVAGTLVGGFASIYIGESAFVERINVLQGAGLSGDILSYWDPNSEDVTLPDGENPDDYVTTLNFGVKHVSGDVTTDDYTADPDFSLRYDGRIFGGWKEATGETKKASIVMNVEGGTLSFNGVADIIRLTVAENAVLGGNAVYKLKTFTNNGTLSPGNSIGTMVIQGNYVEGPSGRLALEFDGSGQTDRIVIEGAAEKEDGSVPTFAADLAPAEGYFTGNVTADFSEAVTIVEKDGEGNESTSFGKISVENTGSPQTLAVSSPTLSMKGTFDKSGVLTVEVKRDADAYGRYASTEEARRVAAAFDRYASVAEGGMRNLVAALDFSNEDGSDLQNAYESLTPDVFSRAGAASLNVFRHVSNALQNVASSHLTAGIDGPNVYAVPLGGYLHDGQSDARSTYGGVLVGLQTAARLEGGTLRSGGHVAVVKRKDVFSGNEKSRLDAETLVAGANLRYDPDALPGLTLFGVAQMSVGNADLERGAAFGTWRDRAESDWTAWGGNLLFGAEQNFTAAPGITLGPTAWLDYAFAHRPDVTEDSTNGAALHVRSETYQSLRSSLGLKGTFALSDASARAWDAKVTVSALWHHEFIDDAGGATASFADWRGVSFTADDADRARDTGSVSVSIEGKIDETFSAALTAGGVFGGGVTGGWGAAHLLWKF